MASIVSSRGGACADAAADSAATRQRHAGSRKTGDMTTEYQAPSPRAVIVLRPDTALGPEAWGLLLSLRGSTHVSRRGAHRHRLEIPARARRSPRPLRLRAVPGAQGAAAAELGAFSRAAADHRRG